MDALQPVDPRTWDVAPRLRGGLGLLAEGWHYARQAQVTVWDFAVELARLRRLHLTPNDLRFLVLQGVVEHALELTVTGDTERTFRPSSGLVFARRTCFVLSTAGAAVVGDLAFASERASATFQRNGALPVARSAHAVLDVPAETPSSAPQTIPTAPTPSSIGTVSAPSPRFAASAMGDACPRWDANRLELRVGQIVLKRFTLPAPHVQSVLAAFEEQQWPLRINNPLNDGPEHRGETCLAAERLQQVIDALNRQQRRPLVRFELDEAGCGVCWQLVAEPGC